MLPDDRGSASLEYAILLPVMLLLLPVITQIVLYYLANSTAIAAAEEGARAEAAYRAIPGSGVQVAETYIHQVGNAFLKTPEATSSGDATTAEIRVRGTAPTLVPLWRLPVDQAARFPRQRFIPATDQTP